MRRKKHKRKVSRIVIFTTDAADARVKQVKLRGWLVGFATLLICCLAGMIIGYALYEEQIWERNRAADAERIAEIERLEEEKTVLEVEIDTLNAKIEALSTAVTENAQTAESLQEELQAQSMPTDYPLTGSAGIEEVTDGDPMVIFNASEGITAVASAKGTVTKIEEDEVYGNKVTVDHGNGYVSIYRNKGDVKVKEGDEVAKGTTLFLIGEDNKELAYQIMYNDAYINPMEMLSING